MTLIWRNMPDTTNSKAKKEKKKKSYFLSREKKPLPFVHFYLHRMKMKKICLNAFEYIHDHFLSNKSKMMNFNDLRIDSSRTHTHTCMSCRKNLFLLRSFKVTEKKNRKKDLLMIIIIIIIITLVHSRCI